MTQEKKAPTREQAKLQATVSALVAQRDRALADAAEVQGELAVTTMERDGYIAAGAKLADALKGGELSEELAEIVKMFEPATKEA
jgi:hypothetical protein